MISTKSSDAGLRLAQAGVSLLIVLALIASAWGADPVTDDTIYNQARIKLASDQVVKGAALELDVKDGTVTLTGMVEQDKQRDRAEKIVRKVRGVKQVVNRITIRSRDSK